jgi:hypothetical protein
MHGREVKIAKSDLPVFLANTLEAIESTRTASGEIVGLPIDPENHNHQGGAGWIVGIELDAVRNILKFFPRWTQIGIDLIKNDIRRFFSAAFDPIEKVIVGGSLTNQPASKDRKGKYLLRPIELSSQLFALPEGQSLQGEANSISSLMGDKPKGEITMSDPIVPTPTPEVTTPAPAPAPAPAVVDPALTELLSSDAAIAEMGKMAEAKAHQIVEMEMRKREVVEFAAKLVGGSKEFPYGLPVKADRIVACLLSLPKPQATFIEELLTMTMKATVNFMESGFNGEFNAHPRVPEQYRPAIKMWLEAKKDLKEFFVANPEVGKAEDFNLSEFVKEA